MKKLVSVILVFGLLLTFAVMPVCAETTEVDYLYRDKLIEYTLEDYYTLFIYNEQYCHTDDDGNVDWALIRAEAGPFENMAVSKVVCDVYIHSNYMSYPFTFGYGIYDAKEDRFISLQGADVAKYDGLEEYINKNIGVPLGDADSDGELSVLDATYIQLAIAQLCEFSSEDYLGIYGCPIQYLSDFDRDGERNILDATAIQLKLAGLE
ncbi:MAG: hypothetical protein IJ275_01790 [Ruminococcus sp.]|nr:hypothetical protein [Ruminococcus sp.]